MNGISPFDSLLTGTVDALPDIKTQLDILSKENLQNTLNLTPSYGPINVETNNKKLDLTKLPEAEVSKAIMSSVINSSPAIRHAPISTPYEYAKKYDSPILGFNPTRGYEEQEDLYADWCQRRPPGY